MSRLIVKNLPKKIGEQRIRELFGQKGRVTDVQLKYTKEGVFRRFCFVGYETNEEAKAALNYFDQSFVDTTKIIVEPCTALGESVKPKKREKPPPEEEKQPKKEKKKKSLNKEKEKEILKEHIDDPEFKEFLKVHKVGNKTVWDNDTSLADTEKNPESLQESIPEDTAKVSKDKGEVEEEKEPEKETKAADESISDMDYMKSLMQKKEKTEKIKKEKKKKPEKEKNTEFFTLKIFNLPYNTKRGDILKFFKPLKPKSVRIPINAHGYCYVGFQDKKDLTKALL